MCQFWYTYTKTDALPFLHSLHFYPLGTVPEWLITVFVDFHSSFLIRFDISSVICTSLVLDNTLWNPCALQHMTWLLPFILVLSLRRCCMRYKCIQNCRVSHQTEKSPKTLKWNKKTYKNALALCAFNIRKCNLATMHTHTYTPGSDK